MRSPEPDEDGERLRAFMRFDVARQLLSVALLHEELVLDDSYPEVSLGAVLVRLVRLFHRPLGASMDVVYRVGVVERGVVR
jgi:hypothetical protein